jgi:hypothetical protein
LGTGISTLLTVGTSVQFIGASEEIPYTDETITRQVISDGTVTVKLPFVPKSANEIEVFVGGYAAATTWTADTEYSVGSFVTVGSYTYECTTEHTSSSTFMADSSNWKFFIGNIRLKKAPYQVFNVNVAPYSPEGDVTFPADFTVDGVSSKITLANPVPIGARITVVKRTGQAWDSSVNIQNDTGKIAGFINAAPGIWYSSAK